MVDICIIILTAFAIFGGYCLAEMIADFTDGKNMPYSVTILPYSNDDYTAKKVKTIYNHLYRNIIIFLSEDEIKSIYPEGEIVKKCEISDVVDRVLFTKP